MMFRARLHRNIRMTYGLALTMLMKFSRYVMRIAIESKPNAYPMKIMNQP